MRMCLIDCRGICPRTKTCNCYNMCTASYALVQYTVCMRILVRCCYADAFISIYKSFGCYSCQMCYADTFISIYKSFVCYLFVGPDFVITGKEENRTSCEVTIYEGNAGYTLGNVTHRTACLRKLSPYSNIHMLLLLVL